MSRVFLVVLDSLGVGGAPDAARYGDVGANTLGHIAQRCADGDADRAGIRSGLLRTSNLAALGLAEACRCATGFAPAAGLDASAWRAGLAGCAAEVSADKISQTGHWEITGIEIVDDWGYFPATQPCFPTALIAALCARAPARRAGPAHASGTQIIAELGESHLRTGKPICYTSADRCSNSPRATRVPKIRAALHLEPAGRPDQRGASFETTLEGERGVPPRESTLRSRQPG